MLGKRYIFCTRKNFLSPRIVANFIATEKAEAIRVEAISVRPNMKKSQTTIFQLSTVL